VARKRRWLEKEEKKVVRKRRKRGWLEKRVVRKD
jgi:hypothetical protein